MNNHFGFAFTSGALHYAYFTVENDSLALDRLGTVPYSQAYQQADFFQQGNAAKLAASVKSQLTEITFANTDISLSIEANLALTKRVAYPQKLSGHARNDHIKWDIEQSVALPVDHYHIFQTPNTYSFKNYYEQLVVAIPYTILDFFKDFSRTLGGRLVNLSVHHLASELLIRNALSDQLEKMIMVQKLVQDHVETIFLWNGTYFASQHDAMNAKNNLSLYIDLLKSKINYIEQLFKQYEEKDIVVERVIQYGDYLPDENLQKIQKNMSIPVERINLFANIKLGQNFNNNPVPDEDTGKYLECIGITLDV